MNGTSIARNQAPITKNIEQNGYSLLIRLRQGERTLLHVITHRIFQSVRNGCTVKASMRKYLKTAA